MVETNCSVFLNNTFQVEIMCGSSDSSEFYDTRIFDLRVPYNLSISNITWNTLIHSTQSIPDTYNSINPSEIVLPFGVWELTSFQTSIQEGLCTPSQMDLITTNSGFENPQQSTSSIIDDVYNNGYGDILSLTNTNLWYFGSGFINSNAYISDFTLNPDGIIKVNQTPIITLEVTDLENDNIESNIIAYYGDSNEQSTNWSGLVGSGTTFSTTFEANKTGNNFVILTMVRDSNHNESVNYTHLFSVGINGALVGDSVYHFNGSIPNITIPIIPYPINATDENNTISKGIADSSNFLGLTPLIFMILLFVASFIIFIIIGVKKDMLVGCLVSSLLCDFIILILFTITKMISSVWFISLMFLMLVGGILLGYAWFSNKGA